jgi:hypothetical protein
MRDRNVLPPKLLAEVGLCLTLVALLVILLNSDRFNTAQAEPNQQTVPRTEIVLPPLAANAKLFFASPNAPRLFAGRLAPPPVISA